MSCLVFSHGKESGPWGRKITAMAALARELGCAVESVDYRGMDDPAARVEKLVAARPGCRSPWCWWARAWAGMCRRPRRARVGPRGVFLLAPAFYMPGYEAYTPAGRALPDGHRARLARRHRAGREQHPLGA